MSDRGAGLTFWMDRVASECARTGSTFDPDAVHDLRVALRRCRSIADGYMAFDPDRSWQDMKRACRALFRELGSLRDIHVMMDWVRRLGGSDDSAAAMLTGHLAEQEDALRSKAVDTLAEFDGAQWLSWRDHLSARSARIPAGSSVFLHLALERWHRAYDLHRTALRNRSEAAFHRLRIGLKRFRYTVENFLPDRHEEWCGDLREVQDLLGENHDLFVLWRTALRIGAFRQTGQRARWRDTVAVERGSRIQEYRRKMCGSGSAFRVWRAGLPAGDDIRALAIARLDVWAGYRDPDSDHSRHVADLAGQMLSGFKSGTRCAGALTSDGGALLKAASLLHDVGRAVAAKDHHRIAARIIRKLPPPLGLDAAQMAMIAQIARYHRGALPRVSHRRLREFPDKERSQILFLAGILRLANAFDVAHNGRIRRLDLHEREDVITICASGYLEQDPQAQNLASARYLLEMSCHMPVWIVPDKEDTIRDS